MESWSGRLGAGLSYRKSYSWLAAKQNKYPTLAKSFRQIPQVLHGPETNKWPYETYVKNSNLFLCLFDVLQAVYFWKSTPNHPQTSIYVGGLFCFPLPRFHGKNVGDHEIFALLTCYAAYTGSYLLTLRGDLPGPSLRVKQSWTFAAASFMITI